MHYKKFFPFVKVVLIILILVGCEKKDKAEPVSNAVFEKSIKDLGQLRDSLQKLDDIIAMSVAVIRPDTTVIWDFGKANENSMFRVGSISKSFAGLSILKLVEDGKLSLDARLDSIAPELQIVNPYKATDPVLVRHVLEASAGFLGFPKTKYPENNDQPGMVDFIRKNPDLVNVSWVPGEFASYHNFGPVISAYLVVKISKQSYQDFVKQNFFEPLGMPHTTFELNEHLKTHLVGYTDSTYRDLKINKPSGALNSSTREFVPLIKMLLQDGMYNNKTILSKESVERFQTSTSNLASKILGLNQGHSINSWSVYFNGIHYNGHGGTMRPNYVNFYAYSREYKTGFVFMACKSKRVGRQGTAEITQVILPFIHPVFDKKTIDKISTAEEDEFLGCYKQVTKRYLKQPAYEISLDRDSVGNLILIDNNWDTPPNKKVLHPTSVKHVYADDDQANNTSTSGQSLYALFKDEEGNQIFQKISLSHEGYKKILCE